jgi:hypothetical protein
VFSGWVFLLAQEGLSFLRRVDNDYNEHCNQGHGKKYFHVLRIAWSLASVLYSGFANTRQKCNA